VLCCGCATDMNMHVRGEFRLRGRSGPRCAAWVFGNAAAAVLRCEGGGGGLDQELCASLLLSTHIACPLNRQSPVWFNCGPFPALTARNDAAKWECGFCRKKCLSHRLRACASQDEGSRHTGGCQKAASTAWMIFALVPVPPSQRSARFLALPYSGWLTFLELTC